MIARHLKTTRGRILSYVVFLVIVALVGGVIGFVDGSRESVGQPSVLAGVHGVHGLQIALVLGLIGAIISFVYGAYWMRSLDEAAQEAHKWSWYWGGSVGMAAGMALIMASLSSASAKIQIPALLSERTDPVAYMAMGAMGIVGLMTICYGVAWVWWWWGRR